VPLFNGLDDLDEEGTSKIYLWERIAEKRRFDSCEGNRRMI
jgi:hypothetical protein